MKYNFTDFDYGDDINLSRDEAIWTSMTAEEAIEFFKTAIKKGGNEGFLIFMTATDGLIQVSIPRDKDKLALIDLDKPIGQA